MRGYVRAGKSLRMILNPVDDAAGPAPLGGPVIWTMVVSDDGTGITMTVAEDTRSAVFDGVTTDAIATITISAPDGDEAAILTEEHEIVVREPLAVNFGVSFEEV